MKTILIVVMMVLVLLGPVRAAEGSLRFDLVNLADTPVAQIEGVAQTDSGLWCFNKAVGITVETLAKGTTVTVIGSGKARAIASSWRTFLALPDAACPVNFEEDLTIENGRVTFPTDWSSGEIRVSIKSGNDQAELVFLTKRGLEGNVVTVYGRSVSGSQPVVEPGPAQSEPQLEFEGPIGFYFWLSWTGTKESIHPAYPVSWGGCDGKLVPTWEMVGDQLTETSKGVPTISQTLGEYSPGPCWTVFPTLFGTDGHPLNPNEGQLHLAIRGMVTGLVPSLAVESLPYPKPQMAWAYWDGEDWRWAVMAR